MGEYAAEIPRTLQRQQAAVVQGLRRGAVLCKAEVVREINATRPHPPVDLGEMRRSYVITPLPTGARLENVAPHAAHQEFGTRPFSAPKSVLLAWAGRKVRGGGGGKGGRRAAQHALAMKAWLAIRRGGIKPKLFHTRASQRFDAIVQRAVLDALRRVTS